MQLQNRLAYLQDEAAYKALFFHFHPLLVRFVNTIVKNRDDAEDVVSETLLKVWTMGRELNYVEDLSLYLFRMARNKAVDILRKQKRDILVAAAAYDQEPGLVDALTPERLYITSELDHYIRTAVEALPTQSQLVFKLIKEQGFTYKQVSGILEISQNTVETHMRLALKKIRLALKSYLATEKK